MEPRTTFSVIGTPIGNLEDITLRALRVLKEVDLILCEDTRVTRILLQKHGITTPTMSYHARSTLSKTDTILKMLAEGKNLALVSDAGTPAISDPGVLLVSEIRRALPEVKIEAIPGPSALVSALSIAGVPSAEFLFLGFLPHKKGRETLFKEIAATTDRAVVFYESPHRIEKTLASLESHFAAANTPSRQVTLARELTKLYEETIPGTPAELIAFFQAHPEKIRGEFVVIAAPVR